MTLKHFIERPVLASVISIVIVIGGMIGVATLPVEQYPDIAPPTVMVRVRQLPGRQCRDHPEIGHRTARTSYQRCGEHDLHHLQRSSRQRLGNHLLPPGTDSDMAAVNVQNKVSRATGQLPSAVTQIGVSTMKRQTSMVKYSRCTAPTTPTTRRSSPTTRRSTSNRASSVFARRRRSLHPRRRLFDARLAETRRNGAVQAHPVGRNGRARRAEHRVGNRYAG